MIGKTRQWRQKPRLEETFDQGIGRARGILRWPPPAGQFTHLRRSPPSDLVPWIDCYWMVTWDLQRRYLQETLPHPNIYLVFENGDLAIGGVSTATFSRVLEGKSGVFGVKFKAGAFRSFITTPVATLLNKIVPASHIFGADADSLVSTLHRLSWKPEKMIAVANKFFRAHLPQPDPQIELANRIVRLILENRDIKTVDDLVERTRIGKRKLQRFFNEYVGIHPKWVIRRYRLHELIDILNRGEEADWSQTALALGYFDQAHLINDFRSIVGHPPSKYQNQT